ncbi:TonB-dependent receptor [Nitrogeniibacter mangrovi]|uniref:TonB-dependent receptor n=1 Tax=Nitrogeniibacter mangrovi TaxID=2016596 RepID=A0A6C1B6A1_9RHOO|nr:TonB-dependent receptor [Nitrogeniibacter mangrovi]QID18963.1 TonB-dependent receptor [Nitrogeniibacter mangrovi]
MARLIGRLRPLGWVLAMVAARPAGAAELLDLSLEQLSSLEVVSVSRKAQRLADTPAAVTVLTAEDIRRSGARSIPEVLRLVPGVQVARIGAGRWAVSVRGLNSRFASRLLVQIDGRSVYSPLFSGVIWEFQNLMLEDVARIEVVRGPGASLWGANAVNGVINIVTRRASETPEALVRLSVDQSGRPEAAVRQGFRWGESASGRVFALSVNRAPFEDARGHSLGDEQTGWRAGFRLDSAQRNQWRVSGEAFRQRSPETVDLPAPGALDATFDYEGAFLSGERRGHWLGGEATLRGYVDYVKMIFDPIASATVSTGDLDFQHRVNAGKRHEWIWGAGVRYQHVDTDSRSNIISFAPDVTQLKTFSAFVQDEIALVPRRWRLSLGARFEARNASVPEWQPSARLLWTPTDRDSVWVHGSRAVRTPSIGERYANLVYGTRTLPFPPVVVTIVGQRNPDLKAEHLRAVELGYRRQWDIGSTEAVVFRHRYDNLIGSDLGPLAFPNQYIVRDNGSAAVVEGLELSADARVSDRMRLLAALTLMRTDYDRTGRPVHDEADAQRASRNADHWFTLQARFDLPARREMDVTVRHSGALKAPGAERVGSYTVVDLRYSHPWNRYFEWELTVDDLFDDHHTEFNSDQFPSPYAYQGRRCVLTGRWRF